MSYFLSHYKEVVRKILSGYCNDERFQTLINFFVKKAVAK